jgi:segregation and condensation protein B
MQEETGGVEKISAEKNQDEIQNKNQSEISAEEKSAENESENRLNELRANLNLDTETALVETVLFLESEPQSAENLAKITKLAPDVVAECISRLNEKYSNADSGIELSMIIGGYVLTPKRDCFEFVKERYGKKNEGRLSKAAVETLSIIAYSQPITRAEIESIRHVNVDNMMRILLDRKFIKEVGKKDIPGKPTMYGTTKEFLEFFHLQSISELPQLDEKESERFELAR